MKTWKDHERFIALRAEGHSIELSSEKIGISKRTGLQWERQHSDIISELQDQGIEQLARTLRVSRERRLSRLATFLDRVDDELEKRDLSGVTTGALVGMKLRTFEVISNLMDAKKVEVGGEINYNNSASTYRQILIECAEIKMSDVDEFDKHTMYKEKEK